MRVILFARLPVWYPFRCDRLATRLMEEGHEVAGIVVERAPTFATLHDWLAKLGPGLCLKKGLVMAARLLGRLWKRPAAAARRRPPVFLVSSHNSSMSVELVRALSPDVIILRGCGIIQWPLLEIPTLGTIGLHYAALPAFRGQDVTEWAALLGGPIAVSLHFVTEGVDTGSVLASRHVPVEAGDTLGRLREKSAALAVELVVEALAKLEAGTAVPRSQQAGDGRQYFAMHPRLKCLAIERLRRAS